MQINPSSLKLVFILDRYQFHIFTFNGFSDGDLLRKPLERVSPLKLLQLQRRVILQELVDAHVAASHSNKKLAFRLAYLDPFRAEFVDAGALAQEHDLQLLPVRVVIHKIRQFHIDRVILDGHIDGHFGLEIDGVDAQRLNLRLLVPDLLKQLQALLVGLVDAIFELFLVVVRLFHVFLVLHSQLFELHDLLSQKFLLLVEQCDLICLSDDQFGLFLVHIQLLFVGLVTGLQLRLQGLILVLDIVDNECFFVNYGELFSQVLDFGLTVCKCMFLAGLEHRLINILQQLLLLLPIIFSRRWGPSRGLGPRRLLSPSAS